jgi:TIR domain
MPNAGHLFLSYSSRDRDKVRAVHRYLSTRGVTMFFDQQNLRAGQNWPQALEQALRDSSAVAVFVGAQIGNWQWSEIGFALDRQANDKQFPVIPVLLDGADISRSFLFLRLDDMEALNRLLVRYRGRVRASTSSSSISILIAAWRFSMRSTHRFSSVARSSLTICSIASRNNARNSSR